MKEAKEWGLPPLTAHHPRLWGGIRFTPHHPISRASSLDLVFGRSSLENYLEQDLRLQQHRLLTFYRSQIHQEFCAIFIQSTPQIVHTLARCPQPPHGRILGLHGPQGKIWCTDFALQLMREGAGSLGSCPMMGRALLIQENKGSPRESSWLLENLFKNKHGIFSYHPGSISSAHKGRAG